MKTFTFFALLLLSGFAIAQNCDDKTSTIDIVDCHTKTYEGLDAQLNQVYAQAMKSLNTSQQAKLKLAQRAWLSFRDASFTFVIEMNKDSGSYGNIVISDYKAKFVEKRIKELNYLLASPADPPVEW
jgi:uncharacterized protein YecT (DUF1311 family)